VVNNPSTVDDLTVETVLVSEEERWEGAIDKMRR